MRESLSHESRNDRFVYNLRDIFQEFYSDKRGFIACKGRIMASGAELLNLLRSYRLDLHLTSDEIQDREGFVNNMNELLELQDALVSSIDNRDGQLLQMIDNSVHIARIFRVAGYETDAQWYFDEAYSIAKQVLEYSEKAEVLTLLIAVEQSL